MYVRLAPRVEQIPESTVSRENWAQVFAEKDHGARLETFAPVIWGRCRRTNLGIRNFVDSVLPLAD
jgi:hypothetical protein